ncbi:apolipoprotein N-acyltransferase [Sulfitobacter aestuarii]|uniref:Apolipoprotein N-acyltransferase n=1 Tax=Sulfitobacter aestuarii TaxID=2161676 RepID=A0ABW5U4N3_9RHOB
MISGNGAIWRFGAPFGLGVIAALGQAPYDLPLLMLAAMVLVIRLFATRGTPWQAALLGWLFGAGYFIHALRWIVSPFLVDVERHGWMAPFALVLLGAGMALFWGLAFWAARRLSPRGWGLILCWPAVELLRAYIFTGFPWALPSQALVDVMAGQALAWVGPYGLTLWLVALAVLLGMRAHGRKALVATQIVAGLAGAALLLLPVQAPPAPLGERVIRLVQPNAAQRDKWAPEMIPVFFRRQLDFTAAAPERGGAPDLVIWSETAIPWPLDLAEPALTQIATAARGTPVMLGVQRRGATRFYNSLVVLDGEGAVAQSYDKHHLVPFGEYVPFGDLLGQFGIHGLAAQAGNGYSSGPGAMLLDLRGIGPALPLICYEAVFAHDVNAAPTRPALLIQLTNDAWFGKNAGPLQHLAQARMRAIEQGLPLARAANTGVSAMIDPQGRIRAMLPLNEAGFLDARLPLPGAPTLYSRSGDLPLALLLLAGLGVAALRARRRFGD